jgi:hypothetical protein
MRIAYLIMAHKSPGQLLRLIERLQHAQFDFYIHIDKKVPLDQFEFIEKKVRVTFIKNRVVCNWGGSNFLKGIINSLSELNALNKYDFISLLSAQDYPLIPPSEIYNYLERNLGTNYISFEASKESKWWKSAVLRYQKYHFTDLNIKWKYFFERKFNAIMPQRKFPGSLELFGSSNATWWTINGDCSEYVVQKLKYDKKLWRFLKYSWGTDEFVISSIIMNSEFKHKVVNNNLRYIDWSEGNAHPKLLSITDFDQICNSKMMFARKFDEEVDIKILDKIDRECLAVS